MIHKHNVFHNNRSFKPEKLIRVLQREPGVCCRLACGRGLPFFLEKEDTMAHALEHRAAIYQSVSYALGHRNEPGRWWMSSNSCFFYFFGGISRAVSDSRTR